VYFQDNSGDRHDGLGEAEPVAKRRLVLHIVKQTGQESGGHVCGNFQILIVSEVKMSKQYLQTASASADWTPYRAFAPGLYWALPFHGPLSYSPQNSDATTALTCLSA